MGELEFRDFQANDRDAILGLLAQGRPASYLEEKRAVFDWQFERNPAPGPSPFIVGVSGGEIVAVNGLMSVVARVHGVAQTACWSLDTYVSSAHRGRGFGKALIARVTEASPTMLGFGISDLSDPILEKAGWVADPAMTTVFYHANETGLRGIAKNLLTRSSRGLRARRAGTIAQIAVSPPPAAEELDETWARVCEHYPNAVVRDGRYLGWRYRDAPKLRYRWVTARRDGVLLGALITRHHPVESAVVDYVGPLDDPSTLASLLEVGCGDLVASGTQRIRCESNDPAVLEELLAVGFVRARVSGRFRVHAAVPGRWFVMTGDSDNDLMVL